MNRLSAWVVCGLILFLTGGGLFGWWWWDLRWRPHDIDKDSAEITRLLEGAGWVSPGLTGPRLYLVGFRSCPDCVRFQTEEFPALHAVGVDTRVIMFARADTKETQHSSPSERATVAELWVNRSWKLLEDWEAVPPDAWQAPGISAADGDAARSAVIEAGRKLMVDLKPLLARNGIRLAYPTLIWWTQDGKMRGCACEKRETYRFIRMELGAEH